MSDNEVDFSLLVGREVPTRYFAKGATIFREGEQGDEFFVVVRGQVEIKSGNRWFETVGQNGIFGEMALIDDSPRSAIVVALTDVTVASRFRNSSFCSWSSYHAVLRTQGDARPRQPAAPAEQGGLTPGLASRPRTEKPARQFRRQGLSAIGFLSPEYFAAFVVENVHCDCFARPHGERGRTQTDCSRVLVPDRATAGVDVKLSLRITDCKPRGGELWTSGWACRATSKRASLSHSRPKPRRRPPPGTARRPGHSDAGRRRGPGRPRLHFRPRGLPRRKVWETIQHRSEGSSHGLAAQHLGGGGCSGGLRRSLRDSGRAQAGSFFCTPLAPIFSPRSCSSPARGAMR